MKHTMDDTVGFDDELSIRDNFLLGDQCTDIAIDRLCGLGLSQSDAMVMVVQWLIDDLGRRAS